VQPCGTSSREACPVVDKNCGYLMLTLLSVHTVRVPGPCQACVLPCSLQGILILDEAQIDYLLALLGSHQDAASLQAAVAASLSSSTSGSSTGYAAGSSSSSAGPSGSSSSSQAGPSGSSSGYSSAGPSGSGAAGGSGSSSSAASGPANLGSLISQVKEIMGSDLGDGFVHAVLHAHGYSAERAIDALLSDTQSPELRKVDRQLQIWRPPAAAGTSSSQQSGSAAGPGPSSSSGATGSGEESLCPACAQHAIIPQCTQLIDTGRYLVLDKTGKNCSSNLTIYSAVS
jgi:hypothetical protein